MDDDEDSNCPECNSRSLERDETRGEVVCQDCGLVIEDNVIDQGAEWRVFSPEQGDQRARTGTPTDKLDKGTTFNPMGKGLGSEWKKRKRIHDHHPKGPRERRRDTSETDIFNMASSLDIQPDTRKVATEYLVKARKAKLLIGRAAVDFTAASLFEALREIGITWSIAEFSEESGVAVKKIEEAAKLMRHNGVIPVRARVDHRLPSNQPDPTKLFEGIFRRIDSQDYKRALNDGIIKKASEIWIHVCGDGCWHGLPAIPLALAAALLFKASNDLEQAKPLTMTELGRATGTSQRAIRKMRRLIE